ncbi:MAG TPA: hypothetical protein VK607_10620 [Kofleriaceae bacterium]|nr:hypothetical protein [Kofleriaceae bacterium]
MTRPDEDDLILEQHSAAWSTGVTLKRTRDGYSWTVSVPALDAEETPQMTDRLTRALNVALHIDAMAQAARPGKPR